MPIRTYAHDELFHETGPEESLDYLWGRLQDRDLSGEEALALLSVVHRQLGAERAGDPRVYFAYTRFMESLSRELPLVHDYVVAPWIENRRSSRRQTSLTADRGGSDADEAGQAETQPARTAPSSAPSPVSFAPVTGGNGEEPEEPGEPDEDEDTAPVRAARERGGEPEAVEEGATESEEGDDEERSDARDDERDDELTDQEEASQSEATADDAEEAAGQGEPEEESGDDESGEEDEPAEPESGDAEPDEVAAEGSGDKVEADEGEWPAEEQLEPPEPTEEMEGEGDEPSPED